MCLCFPFTASPPRPASTTSPHPFCKSHRSNSSTTVTIRAKPPTNWPPLRLESTYSVRLQRFITSMGKLIASSDSIGVHIIDVSLLIIFDYFLYGFVFQRIVSCCYIMAGNPPLRRILIAPFFLMIFPISNLFRSRYLRFFFLHHYLFFNVFRSFLFVREDAPMLVEQNYDQWSGV